MRFSELGRAARVLPVVGLMAAFSIAPAFADVAPVSNPGALAISEFSTGSETVGSPEVFTITVTNTTAGDANGVFLGATLPAGARLTGTLTGTSPNLCARTGQGGVQGFACLVGTIPASASYTLGYTVIPTTPTIVNKAVATGFAGGSFTTNGVSLTESLATGATTVGLGGGGAAAPDVQVTGFATTGQPAAGSAFGYVFQVKNGGNALASAVSFSDTLPAGVTPFGAASAAGPCSMVGQTISCDLGDIQVGQTVLVGIAAFAPAVGGGVTYTDTGSAATTSAESNLANNSANVSIKVN